MKNLTFYMTFKWNVIKINVLSENRWSKEWKSINGGKKISGLILAINAAVNVWTDKHTYVIRAVFI